MSNPTLTDELTPQQVFPDQAEDDSQTGTKASLFARRTGKTLSKASMMARGTLLTASGLVLLMGILFAASALLNMGGSFTIKAIRPVLENKAISLSETEGFSNPTVKLDAKAIEEMDNITYDWLPLDVLDTKSGSYNGDNYIAYTFYVANTGKEILNYSAALHVTEYTLGVDKAVRTMVYHNGVPTVFAAPAKDGSPESVPDNVVNFASETTVFVAIREGFEVGEKDRWTVVIWLEGEDPECINNVRGGTMKMELDMDILDDEPTADGEQSADDGEEIEPNVTLEPAD